MKRLALIVVLVLIAPVASTAETLENTSKDWELTNMTPEALNVVLGEVTVNGPLVMEFEFTPYRSGGTLDACGYSYSVLMKDWAYRSNQPIWVSGSIVYWANSNRRPYLTHKIVIQDIEERDNKVWKKRTPVNFAYLRLGDESLAGEEDSVLELEDGFKNFAYLEDSNPEKTLMRYLVIPDSLSVWFNRTPKSTDLSFELSFVEHQEAWLSLAACFKEMSGIQN